MKRSSIVTYVSRVFKAQDIRRKILITLLILGIYRLAALIPVPGANRAALDAVMNSSNEGTGNILGIMDMLTGGTLSNFSVLSMGVYPYITAQIILQLLVPIVPSWKARMEDDQREGKRWMERTTYILCVPMAVLQVFSQIQLFSFFAQDRLGPGVQVIPDFAFSGASLVPSLAILLSMTAGTMFAIWLGELISEYGIRQQGLSLIIVAGIITQIPSNFSAILQLEEQKWLIFLLIFIITLATIFVIVYVQQGRRNVPVMYPGRRVGNRMSMPVKGSLPLMVNMSGMIPIIFAQAILSFPTVLAPFFLTSENESISGAAQWLANNFNGTGGIYWLFFFLMVVSFTFFYTEVLFSQQNYGENLKRAGAQIPGVSRGDKTQDYLTRVLRRITFPGAVFLGLVAILPYLVQQAIPILSVSGLNQNNVLLVSSSGLLIVVGVVRDLFYNIDAELKLHGYDDTLLVS